MCGPCLAALLVVPILCGAVIAQAIMVTRMAGSSRRLKSSYDGMISIKNEHIAALQETVDLQKSAIEDFKRVVAIYERG